MYCKHVISTQRETLSGEVQKRKFGERAPAVTGHGPSSHKLDFAKKPLKGEDQRLRSRLANAAFPSRAAARAAPPSAPRARRRSARR